MTKKINSLLAEKSILEKRLKRLEHKRGKIYVQAGPMMSRSESYVDADSIHGSSGHDAEKQLQAWMDLTTQINACKVEIAKIDRQIKVITSKIKSLDKIEKKIMILRDEVGMNLREIAEELGHNYDYIRQVSAKTHSLPHSEDQKNVL